MRNATDLLVDQLCSRTLGKRAFRDRYDLPNLVSLWRNYVAREDRFNRYAEMTSHGPSHMEGVASLVAGLARPGGFLTDSEVFVLLAAAYLHDVGMYETQDRFYSRPLQMRQMHGEHSRERILRERHLLLPECDDDVVQLIATVCAYHQGKAALSADDLAETPPKKRLRCPAYLYPNYRGKSYDIDPLELPEQPSLQQRLAGLVAEGHEPFSLAAVKSAIEEATKARAAKHVETVTEDVADRPSGLKPQAKDVCPFLLATLLKLLDGCDFQASRTGSIETLLRHASRNSSHAARSRRIIRETTSGGTSCESPTYRRAAAEADFFSGSVFHFARNLLIEQTVLLYDKNRNRVDMVIKTAAPDDIIALCERIVIPPGKEIRDAEPDLRETLNLLEQYQADPRMAIIDTLKLNATSDFLEEWDVAVPAAQQGDRRTVHFLVAKRYIERELKAVSRSLASRTADGEYHYCPVCPNRQECRLKHRPVPSFRDGNGNWNVQPFDASVHSSQLAKLPHLAPNEEMPALPAGAKRDRAPNDLAAALRQHKQILLYGPRGRGRHVTARLAIHELFGRRARADYSRHVFWHAVAEGDGQSERFVVDLADFLAGNGDFALQNLIRGEQVTLTHQQYAVEILASGRLAPSSDQAVFCIDGFNDVTTRSRAFFRNVTRAAICTNCPSGRQCDKPPEGRWGCPQAKTLVLLISTKAPGQSWEQTPGQLRGHAVAAPALDDSELSSFAANAFPDEPACRADVCETWRRYGGEPVGVRMLEGRKGKGWDSRRRVALFAQDMAEFFVQTLSAASLGERVDSKVLKLIGLLQGHLSEAEIERIFPQSSTDAESPLRRLTDRDLVHVADGKLHAHAACDAGHAQSGWMDRIGEHPRDVLLRYVVLGDNPAQTFRDRWKAIAPYWPELESLEGLAGGQHHTHDVLTHSLLTLETLDRVVGEIDHHLSGHSNAIRDHLATGLPGSASWPGIPRGRLLRLAALFHDIGKKQAYREDQGRVSFHDHEGFGVELWSRLAKAAGMESRQAEHVKAVIERHMHPLCLFGGAEVTDHAIKALIQRAGEQLPEILLLFLADMAASGTIDERREEAQQFVIQILDRAGQIYAEQSRASARRLTGDDLVKAGIPPGRLLGKVLNAVNQTGQENPDTTDEQLLDMARRLYAREQAGGGAAEGGNK